MRAFLDATAFLTTLNVGAELRSRPALARSVVWFPVVGAGIGLAVALAYAAWLTLLPPPVAAVIAVATGAALTGGIHEDGLADAADAFFGGSDKQDVLRILKDPAHGTFGTLAICFSVLLRVVGLASLDPWTAVGALAAAHAMSRAAAIGLLAGYPPANEAGMAAAHLPQPHSRRLLATVCLGIVIATVCLGLWVVPSAVLTGLAAWWIGRRSYRRIGGLSGDILGAAQQTGEILILLVAAAIATRGWPSIPWWS